MGDKLEKLVGEGVFHVDASVYKDGNQALEATEKLFRENKSIKQAIYDGATKLVADKLYSVLHKDYTIFHIGESLILSVKSKTPPAHYNPLNPPQEKEKFYQAGNSVFYFDKEGRFKIISGDEEGALADGTVPELVVGINPGYKERIQLIFGGNQRHGLKEFMKQHGEELKPGNHLVFVLPKTEAENIDRIGFYSSKPLVEMK